MDELRVAESEMAGQEPRPSDPVSDPPHSPVSLSSSLCFPPSPHPPLPLSSSPSSSPLSNSCYWALCRSWVYSLPPGVISLGQGGNLLLGNHC